MWKVPSGGTSWLPLQAQLHERRPSCAPAIRKRMRLIFHQPQYPGDSSNLPTPSSHGGRGTSFLVFTFMPAAFETREADFLDKYNLKNWCAGLEQVQHLCGYSRGAQLDQPGMEISRVLLERSFPGCQKGTDLSFQGLGLALR